MNNYLGGEECCCGFVSFVFFDHANECQIKKTRIILTRIMKHIRNIRKRFFDFSESIGSANGSLLSSGTIKSVLRIRYWCFFGHKVIIEIPLSKY
jgi:hypothetical protein